MWQSHHDGRTYQLHVFEFPLLSWGRRSGGDCLTTPLTFSLLMFVWHTWRGTHSISWIWSGVWEKLESNQVFTPCTIHFQMNIFGYSFVWFFLNEYTSHCLDLFLRIWIYLNISSGQILTTSALSVRWGRRRLHQNWHPGGHFDFYRTRVRSLAMLVTHSLTHSLTHWLLFSKLDWCDPGI